MTYGQCAEPPEHVPSRVPPKGTLRLEGGQQTRPCDGEHEVEEPECRRCQTHAVSAHVERIGLGAVCERHRAHARTVGDAVKVDAHCDQSGARDLTRDPKDESGEEEGDGKHGEGCQDKGAPTERVDCIDGWDRLEECLVLTFA